MGKATKFIVLQGSVVFNNQLSFIDKNYPDTKDGRNQAFRDTVLRIKDKKVIKINPKITEYILVYKAEISNDLVYCQLAKRTQMEAFKLSEDQIMPEEIDSYPPLDVFINLTLQQIVVELNSSILSEASIEKTMQKLINSVVSGYNIFINTIQDRKDFWALINDDDEIQEISFDLIVPNLFDATGEALDLVSTAKDKLNADSVGLSIRNKKGKLKAELTAIDSYVRYASLTGAWRLKIKQSGDSKYKKIYSTDFCLKKTIDAEILELVKKINTNWQISKDVYNGLIERIMGLFGNEE